MEPSQVTPAVLLPGVTGLATFFMLFIQCIELPREFIEGEFTDQEEFIVEGFIVDIGDRLRGGGTEIPQVELWNAYDAKNKAFTRLRNRYEEFRGHPNYRNIQYGLERRRRIRNSNWFSALDKQEAGNVDPLKYDDYILKLREAAEDSLGSVVTGAGVGYGVKRFRAYVAGRPGIKPIEYDMGWMPEGPPPSAFTPTLRSSNSAGDPPDDLNNNKMSSGVQVLARRMETQKMYHTMCTYNMSAIKITNRISASDPWIHKLAIGSGPGLYTTYQYGLTDVSGNRNPDFNAPNLPDADFNSPNTSMYNVGTTSPVYVFAADWPWLTMNHDTRTQPAVADADKDYRYLRWNYLGTDTGLNDPNIPLTMTDFITNPDWKYIKVYGIQYTFDFTNFDSRNMCVEILLFRFKADPDAMDYKMQVNAPYSRQTRGFINYVVTPSGQYAAQDISIINRKRLIIPGLDQLAYKGSNWSTIGSKNYRRHIMNITRQYVITRPVLKTTDGTLDEITEDEFFRTYYEPHKGIYCRIQAWPMNAYYSSTPTSALDKLDNIDTLMKPTAADSGTVAPQLDVRILKRSSYKFDTERITALAN